MMRDGMMGGGMGAMMWGMGLLWLLVAVILVLGVAALLKYLFPAGGADRAADRAQFVHLRRELGVVTAPREGAVPAGDAARLIASRQDVFGCGLAVVPSLRPYEASSEHGGQWI